MCNDITFKMNLAEVAKLTVGPTTLQHDHLVLMSNVFGKKMCARQWNKRCTDEDMDESLFHWTNEVLSQHSVSTQTSSFLVLTKAGSESVEKK